MRKKKTLGERVAEAGQPGVPFWPMHAMKEMMVMLCILIALLFMAVNHPAGLEEPADPFSTPEHIKPEWYFLFMYQMLKYVPQGEIFKGFSWLNAAVLFQGFGFLLVFLLPFFDKYPGRAARRRPLFFALGILFIVFAVTFTYIGKYSGYPDPLFHITFK